MCCLVLTINQINSHADLLDPEERFYELPFNVSAFVVENVPAEEIEKIKSASIVDLEIVPSRRVAVFSRMCLVFLFSLLEMFVCLILFIYFFICTFFIQQHLLATHQRTVRQ